MNGLVPRKWTPRGPSKRERDTDKEFQVLMEMMGIPSGHDWGEKLIWLGLEGIREKIRESKGRNSKW
jgi:hypothetical protein